MRVELSLDDIETFYHKLQGLVSPSLFISSVLTLTQSSPEEGGHSTIVVFGSLIKQIPIPNFSRITLTLSFHKQLKSRKPLETKLEDPCQPWRELHGVWQSHDKKIYHSTSYIKLCCVFLSFDSLDA